MFQFNSTRCFNAATDHNESIYNLVAKCERECRPPRYVSRFACKVRQEAYCRKKGCFRTMGLPKMELESPQCFLRKYSKTYPCFWKRPIGLKSKSCSSINFSVQDKHNWKSSTDKTCQCGQTCNCDLKLKSCLKQPGVLASFQHSDTCCFHVARQNCQKMDRKPAWIPGGQPRLVPASTKSKSNPEITCWKSRRSACTQPCEYKWPRPRNCHDEFSRHPSRIQPCENYDECVEAEVTHNHGDYDEFHGSFNNNNTMAMTISPDCGGDDTCGQHYNGVHIETCDRCPRCNCGCHINYPNMHQDVDPCNGVNVSNNCDDGQDDNRIPAGYSGGFGYIEKGCKDYIRENALAVLRLPPKIPQKRIIDNAKGHRADWNGQNMLKKKGFGQVPAYIECRKQQLCADALEMKMAVERENKCRPLCDETRCLIIQGLELQWADVYNEYQHLPLFTASARIFKLKGQLENQLRDLEKDLQLFKRNGPLFVDNSLGAKSRYV